MSRFDRHSSRASLSATEPKSRALLISDSTEAAAIDPQKAQVMLEEAKAVLAELQAGLQVVEAKLEEERRTDAIKGVRGVSSLEEAIRSTQDLISVLERGLAPKV